MTVCLENLICPAGFAVFVFYVHSIAEETAQKCHTALTTFLIFFMGKAVL